MFSRSTTTTTTTTATTTMILVVRMSASIVKMKMLPCVRISIFFFYLIFHRSNTKKLTATRTRTTTIKVASSFTVVRYVLSNEDALCVCVAQEHKNPFFLKIFIYFLDPHVAKKDLICFSVFFFSCSAVFFTKMSSQSLFSKELHTQQRR